MCSCALYLLGIALAALTTVPQNRYGRWLDPDAVLVIRDIALPYGIAAVMIVLHWSKVVLVAATVLLWRRQLRTAALVVGVICFGLAALSLMSSMALLELNRIKRANTSDALAQREADLRVEMKVIVERLALIGWRPLATVTAEIAAERRQYAWDGTSECTRITTGTERRYCARLDKLDGERIVALEADRLRHRESEVRQALAQQPVVTTGRQPDLALLADVLGVPPDRAELLRTLVYSMLVEIVEITLFWVAGLLVLGSTSVGREDLDQTASGSDAVRRLGAKRILEGLTQPAACAGVRQTTRRAPLAPTAAVGRDVNTERASRPSIMRQSGSSAVCPRVQQPMSPAASFGLVDERRRAVAAFVALLPRSPSARATGSALFAAYDDRRVRDGWPPIPPNVFGTLLKPSVVAAGGRKIKSDRQVYLGVGVPPV